MFSLRDLCSRDLDIQRAQRIMGFYLNTQKSTRSEIPSHGLHALPPNSCAHVENWKTLKMLSSLSDPLSPESNARFLLDDASRVFVLCGYISLCLTIIHRHWGEWLFSHIPNQWIAGDQKKMNFIWSKLGWKGDYSRASILFCKPVDSAGYPSLSSQSNRVKISIHWLY